MRGPNFRTGGKFNRKFGPGGFFLEGGFSVTPVQGEMLMCSEVLIGENVGYSFAYIQHVTSLARKFVYHIGSQSHGNTVLEMERN